MTTTRRLAAVLAADVVGYSRLMGADEEGTLKRLQELRQAFINPAVRESGGRIVKTTGDGFLIEFPSAVEAVRCALEIQDQVDKHEQVRASDKQFQFRMGINVGDVIVSEDDIHGDGVNVAARLEASAEPGGILVSATVHATAANRLPCAFDDLGERSLKNIEKPVRVYRVSASRETTERPALALPDKPSIAVLPFQNMSGDPEQEYFADGMVEEIITGLSRVRSFFVIARNSSFTYKGRAVDVKQVGRELRVRYVLEGSVRKAGNRVRITGQLIDAATGAHLWADRFDGVLEGVFELQDRVTTSVVTAIEPTIRRAEISRARSKSPQSLQAYDLVLKALPYIDVFERGSMKVATDLLREATAIDPTYGLALAYRARVLWLLISLGWTKGSRSATEEVVRLARSALQHGSDDSEVLGIAGCCIGFADDLLRGLELVKRALVLNPNSASALRMAGQLSAYAGDTSGAIEYLEQSERLNPLAGIVSRSFGFAVVHFVAGRYEEVLTFSDRGLRESPSYSPLLRYRAASLGLLGRDKEAAEAVMKLKAVAPEWTVSQVRAHLENDMNHIFKKDGVVDAVCEGLRRAGLPE